MFGLTIARGGSRRLPGKNAKLLCGHPLVAWTIVQMKTACHVDDVYLSTDTDELAEIGERYGAKIIRRPDWPNPDELVANVPYCHALQTLLDAGKIQRSDPFISTLPTTPLVFPGQMDELIENYNKLRLPTVTIYAKQRETVVLKVLPWNKIRWTMLDKNYGFATQGPSVTVCDVAWYLHMQDTTPDTDKEVEERITNGHYDGNWPVEADVGLWVEPWQNVDTDTQTEFE